MRDGTVIHPLVMDGGNNVAGGPNYTATDSNGNRITVTTRSTTSFQIDHVTDNYGTSVLTSTGGVPTPGISFTYTSPSGVAAPVVATYITKTVQTAFGCPNSVAFSENNDYLLDRVTLPDSSYYQFTYEATSSGSNNTNARLKQVRLPTGGTITYTYTGGDTGKGISCIDGSTMGFDRATPDGTWHYSRVVNSSSGNTITSSTTTVTDPQGNVTVTDFYKGFEVQRKVYQGGASGTPLEEVATCYNGNLDPTLCPTATVPTTGITEVTVFRRLNGGPWAETDTVYNSNFSNGSGGLVTDAYVYDFGASSPTRHTHIDYDTTLGNGIVDHPSVVTVTDGSGNLKAKTEYTYDEDQGSLQTSGAASLVAVSCTPGFSKCRGNATTVKRYVTASSYLTSTAIHYDTGQVYQATDANGAQTRFTYGNCGHSLLTNALSVPFNFSTSFTWNCVGGVTTSSTDANGSISYVNYTTDPDFWRPESSKDPLLNITHFTYTSLVKSEGYLNFNSTTSTVDGLSQLDSLGRSQYTQQKQAQTATNYDTVKQVYDSLGRPYQTTVPYVATAASPGPPQNTPISSTTYYDAMSRPTQVIDGGGGIANLTYNQNDVYREIAPAPTVPPAPASENTKRSQMEYDGLGRLISVCEINGGNQNGPCNQHAGATGYWTQYSYDTIAPSYNSLIVTQNSQAGGGTSQSRTYVHDMLGRLTSETNPENGQTQYFYDSAPSTPGVACPGPYNGDLVKKYDAQGNTICYTYDALHRLTSVTYPAGPNHSSSDPKYFVYDAATAGGYSLLNTKGRLAEAYTCPSSGSCTPKKTDLIFSYSARGEVLDTYESTPHSGTPYYHVSASYWAHGAVNALGSNLTGLPTFYYGATNGVGLEGEGRVTSVTASSGQNPVTGVTYTTANGTGQPIGSLTQVVLGSGDKDTFSYDPNTGRLLQYNFIVGATPQTVQGNLTWNANGTLAKLAITDPFNTVNNQTCTFGYDDLARSTSANCGSSWSQTFSFDPFGNVTKTGTSSFQPGYDQATNKFLSLPGLSYNNNGDLNNDSFNTYTWDSENRPVSVDTVNLTLDAFGRMVEQARGTSYTQIVYGPGGGKLALMTGQTLSKAFVPLPGGGTAVYGSTGTLAYYRHADWLGSSRFASTPTRTKYFDVAYAPYGEDYADSGTMDLDFTGQNQDTVSGLYDFLYREYHAVSGRWINPDPAGLGAVSLTNPQTWNRYAYVSNNPLSAVDPLGLIRCWGTDCPQRLGVGSGNSGDFPSQECVVEGVDTDCGLLSGFLQDGAAAVCPNNYCGARTVVGPTGDAELATVSYTAEGFSYDYVGLRSQFSGRDYDFLVEALGLPDSPTKDLHLKPTKDFCDMYARHIDYTIIGRNGGKVLGDYYVHEVILQPTGSTFTGQPDKNGFHDTITVGLGIPPITQVQSFMIALKPKDSGSLIPIERMINGHTVSLNAQTIVKEYPTIRVAGTKGDNCE
ncbi:MAG: hypothetical protein LAO03_17045 [Acidobacteriia bacterium]|nr:hypothetical protein [Terriglobia bacterium]